MACFFIFFFFFFLMVCFFFLLLHEALESCMSNGHKAFSPSDHKDSTPSPADHKQAAAPPAAGHIDILEVSRLPRRYEYQQLHEATDGFTAFVGSGSYAQVYKGRLPNGDSVVVKRVIAEVGDDIAEACYERELIASASLHHVNIVRFIGYCYVPSRHRYSVYEFCEQGSLDSWIFEAERCLAWDVRCRIAVDVAKALRYLHHDCYDKIIHLDVRPHTVLLDREFQALLSGFWQSQVLGKDEEVIMIKGGASAAYMAPERFLRGSPVSEKADVYAYGMLLLVLVHGEKNEFHLGEYGDRSGKQQPYPKVASDWVRRQGGDIKEVVDKRLLEVDEERVRTLLCVALWCIQDDPKLRPSMKSVVAMLEGKTSVDVPPVPGMMVLDLLFHGNSTVLSVQGRRLQYDSFNPAASFTLSERLSAFRRASLLRLLRTDPGDCDKGGHQY